MSRIIKELDIIEVRDKTIAEAEIQLAIRKDLETQQQKETKEERKARELRWILTGEGYF